MKYGSNYEMCLKCDDDYEICMKCDCWTGRRRGIFFSRTMVQNKES